MGDKLSASIAESLTQLSSTSYSERQDAFQFLKEHASDITNQLLDLVRDQQHPQSTEALKLLRYSDDDRRINVFEEMLRSSNPIMAQAAVTGLQSLNPLPIDTLLNSLPFIHRLVVPHIARILGDANEPELLDVLKDYLEHTQEAVIKYTIISILGNNGDQDLIPVIKKFLDDENHHVRSYATKALEKLTVSDSINE